MEQTVLKQGPTLYFLFNSLHNIVTKLNPFFNSQLSPYVFSVDVYSCQWNPINCIPLFARPSTKNYPSTNSFIGGFRARRSHTHEMNSTFGESLKC